MWFASSECMGSTDSTSDYGLILQQGRSEIIYPGLHVPPGRYDIVGHHPVGSGLVTLPLWEWGSREAIRAGVCSRGLLRRCGAEQPWGTGEIDKRRRVEHLGHEQVPCNEMAVVRYLFRIVFCVLLVRRSVQKGP